MTIIRIAMLFILITPTAGFAGELITLDRSPSIQARIESQWEKTHPMNNSRNEYTTAQNPSCQTTYTTGGARVTTCR